MRWNVTGSREVILAVDVPKALTDVRVKEAVEGLQIGKQLPEVGLERGGLVHGPPRLPRVRVTCVTITSV